MSSKTRVEYAQVFEVLKQKAKEVDLCLAPTTIMTDFECGMIAAVRDEFPNAHHQGCYFHFTQVDFKLFEYLIIFLLDQFLKLM